MKKNLLRPWGVPIPVCKNQLCSVERSCFCLKNRSLRKKLIMHVNVTAFLLLLGCLQLSATSLSQTVSMDATKQPLSKVFEEIEEQTGYYVMYNSRILQSASTVTIKVTKMPLTDFLTSVLGKFSLKYTINEKTILVTRAEKKERPNVSPAPFQQQREISGRIANEQGEPLEGATISVKNTTIATTTDATGYYRISPPDGSNILVVTIVGYEAQEIRIGAMSVINVVLRESVSNLEEVVVVGYGVQQKKTLTGAVSSVNEAELRAIPAGDAAARLQGRVAGVTVTGNSSPGGVASVRIRGIGSINNNDPLYIVDGVPTTGGLTNINPNDIESMTVLKDASSSAIYGSRAANGVIVITTKQGKSGKPVLNFDARYGLQRASNQLGLLNTQELGELLWLENRNNGLTPGSPGWGDLQYGYGENPTIPDYIFPAGKMEGEVDESLYNYPQPYYGITRANKQGTQWYDEIFSTAPIQEYNLSVSGGGERATYAVSAGYMDQQGIVNHTGFERYALRLNTNLNVTDWLEVGQNLGATYTDRTGFGNNDEYNPVSMAHRMHPIIPVYDIMGNFAGSQVPGTGNGQNPAATLFRNKDDFSQIARILANTHIQMKVNKNITFKSLLGIDYSTNRSKDRTLMDPEYVQTNYTSRLNESYNGGLQYNWANTLNYLNTFGEGHRVNFLLGSEALSNKNDFFNGARSTFAFTDLDYMVLNSGEKDFTNGGSFDEWKLFSYFGRLNYDYQGKYLFEGVIRRDGSSRFAEANRWGTFPAVSAGWRLSEEPFLNDVSYLSDLKLRVGWGKNGNDNVGNYNSYSTYRAHGRASYYNISGSSNTNSVAGFHKYTLGNPDAKWEATTTSNIGLDVSLFNHKLELNLDVFNRATTNMLYPDSRPDTWGGLVLPSVNIGEMQNRGFDLILTYRDKIGEDFSYNITSNFSHYKNKVIRLNDNPNEIRFGNSLREEVYTASMSGQPISSFFGYVVEGIFNTAEEVAAHPKYNPDINGFDAYSRPGVLKYGDVNGDGKITPDDRTFIGSPHPDLTYGLNLDLKYKNWDMTMFFQGVIGNSVINYVNRWTLFNLFEGNRKKERLHESWTPERYANGDVITVPIAIREDAPMQKPSSFFVEDASYFRMKDLQLGYSLPVSLSQKLNISRLRVYMQANNLFTITKYSGLDPEVSISNDRHMGVDGGVYPTSQTFMFGVNLSL